MKCTMVRLFFVGLLAVLGCKDPKKVIDAPPTQYLVTVGGAIVGLEQTTVVLQNNGGDNLTVAQNGAFVFPTEIFENDDYEVTVLTQPSNPTQACTVANGSGVAGRTDVTNVVVTCTTSSFKIGGTVTGLDGTGLTLTLGTEELPVAANGAFEFATPVKSGQSFTVGVGHQPTMNTQTCEVMGNGTVGAADVTTVVVACANDRFMVGGSITGLQGSLVLQNNLTDDLTITTAGDSTFAFPTTVPSGTGYHVTVKTQPANLECAVANAQGTVTNAHITSVTVTCSRPLHTIGGTIVHSCAQTIRNNATDILTFPQGFASEPFTFTIPIAEGSSYNVTADLSGCMSLCTVMNGAGIVGTTNITNVMISCLPPPDA